MVYLSYQITLKNRRARCRNKSPGQGCKKMNTRIKFSDKLRSGGVTPRLYLVKGKEFVKFSGQSIQGFCIVETKIYEKAGKWSGNDFTILLNSGVVEFRMCSPLHGLYGQNASDWKELYRWEKINPEISIEVVKEVITKEYPKTAARLNELEEYVRTNYIFGQNRQIWNQTGCVAVCDVFLNNEKVDEIHTAWDSHTNEQTKTTLSGKPVEYYS